MIRAVLWDLDGTLVDSMEQHWRAWSETMAARNVALTRQQFLSTFGMRNESFLPGWLGPAATPDEIRRVAGEKEACYRRIVRASGLAPLPGAVEWVTRLRSEGWRQAVASSAPRANVIVMIEALGLSASFDALAASEDVEHGKPDPQVFLTAGARLGAGPEACIVVEDAAAGIEAARRARMRSIGISHNGKPLAADLPVRSLTELAPDAFDTLLASAR